MRYFIVLSIILIVTGILLAKYMQKYSSPESFTIKSQSVRIGIIGDSQSDEYRADDDRGGEYSATTINWVEQLANYRKIDMGVWGERPEPRRTGYANNWARSGATAVNFISQGQHSGLAEQIKNKEIDVAIIYIGANDFAPYNQVSGYQPIYSGKMTDQQIQQKIAQIVENITNAVDTLQPAGEVQILLVKLPDWGKHLAIQLAFPEVQGRNRVSEAISQTNDALETMAKDKKIAIADPNLFYDELTEGNQGFTLQVGNVTMDRLNPSDEPTHLFLSDAIHPGAVLNGLFANFIIEQINTHFGYGVPPFSTDEILMNAGIKK